MRYGVISMETEKRLIDANEIEDLFYKQVEYGATDLMDAFDDALQDAQTVDAVEVVRCKDCRKWFRHTQVDRERGDCRRYQTTKHENGFCDRGERRTDGEV